MRSQAPIRARRRAWLTALVVALGACGGPPAPEVTLERYERQALTEAFGLLAIAAHETGNREEFLWALEQARGRGVDVSVLERAADIPPDGTVTRH